MTVPVGSALLGSPHCSSGNNKIARSVTRITFHHIDVAIRVRVGRSIGEETVIPNASRTEAAFMTALAFAVVVAIATLTAIPRAAGIAGAITPAFGPQLPLLY